MRHTEESIWSCIAGCLVMSNTAWFHLSQERLLSKSVRELYLKWRLHCCSSILSLLFHSTGAVAAERMRER